jgi:DNA-binding beta-propeller fold protein YncE
LGGGVGVAIVMGAACGGSDTATTTTAQSSTQASVTASSTTSGMGGMGGVGGMGMGGMGGTGPMLCTTTAKGGTRGSAIALSPDDKRIVAVNRDTSSVTVMSVDYTDQKPKMTVVAEIKDVGAEPWQVALDACGKTAYVISRKDQRLVEITDIDTMPTRSG